MSVLLPAVPHLHELGRETAAVGGMWEVPRAADRTEVVAEATERGVRALSIDGGDAGFLADLPEIEFLTLASLDVSSLPVLPRLRHLEMTDWKGRLPWSELPRLEWFIGSEGPKAAGIDGVLGAPRLRSMTLHGVHRDADLTALTAPALEALWLEISSALTSLTGIERHADRLAHLDLFRLPNLESLEQLAQLRALECLHVAGLRHVTSLEQVAAAPALRLLDISEQKKIESLAPLAGHPTLEFVAIGKTVDMDLSPLREIPNLKVVSYGYVDQWKGGIGEALRLQEADERHPDVREWRRTWEPGVLLPGDEGHQTDEGREA